MSTALHTVAGGALIGLSASALWLLAGRIAGVSGIVGGLVHPRRGDVSWRAAFVAGLLSGGLLLARLNTPALGAHGGSSSPLVFAVAGLLVGVGTQLGGGCTSGHGVCGLGRASPRSVVAVATFMATGALATFLVRHVLGGRCG